MNSRGIRTLSKLHSEYVIIRKCVRCASKNHASFSVGDKATLTKTFTNDDVETFAKISMDHNPLHTDPDFAKTTKFGKCIVHGVLINGYIFFYSLLFISILYIIFANYHVKYVDSDSNR